MARCAVRPGDSLAAAPRERDVVVVGTEGTSERVRLHFDQHGPAEGYGDESGDGVTQNTDEHGGDDEGAPVLGGGHCGGGGGTADAGVGGQERARSVEPERSGAS